VPADATVRTLWPEVQDFAIKVHGLEKSSIVNFGLWISGERRYIPAEDCDDLPVAQVIGLTCHGELRA
jgi:hypothetical protein